MRVLAGLVLTAATLTSITGSDVNTQDYAASFAVTTGGSGGSLA